MRADVGVTHRTIRRVETRGSLSERRSARQKRAGRRFARWLDELQNWNRLLLLRCFDDYRGIREDAKDGEREGIWRRLRRSGKIQVVVGRWMRNVIVGVAVMFALVVPVRMKRNLSDRREQVIQMRRTGEMNRDIIDVKPEQRGDKQSPPPTRRTRRAVRMSGAA